MCTGVIDVTIDAYVEDETPSTLAAVVDAILKKVPRCLAVGIAMQLLEAVHQQYEAAEMEVEDATLEAETLATANAFKRIAAAVLAASPGI